MKKIKVLHIVKTLGLGGAEVNLLNIAKCMDQARFELHVAYSFGGELEPRFKKAGVKLFKFADKNHKVKSLATIGILMQLVQYILSQRIQIVHTHTFSAHIWGGISARLSGRKIIEHVHDFRYLEPNDFARRRGLNNQYKYIYKFKNLSDRVIVLTQQNKDFLIKEGIYPAERILEYQNGIPLNEGQASANLKDRELINEFGLPSDSLIILSSLRIASEKNIDLILRIAPEVVCQVSNAVFLIAGDGPLIPQIEIEIKKKNLEKNVKLTGYRSNIQSLLINSDIFLLPSFLELHSIAILEAMSAGVPIVASQNVGCNSEFIINWKNGVLLDPFNDEGWAEAIIKLLENRELRKQIGNSGRKTCIEKFDIKDAVRKIEDFMFNLWIFNYKFWITAVISCVFAIALTMVLPILSKKIIYLIALPLGFLFFTILVIKPKWVLIILLLFRPLLDNLLNLTRSNIGGGVQGIGLGAIFNIIIIFLTIFLFFLNSKLSRHNTVFRYWVLFLFVMFVAVLYSPFKFSAIRLCFDYLSYFAMFFIPSLIIKNKEEFLFWLKILALSFVLPVFCADIDLLRGGHYYPDTGTRVGGTFSHPNILAFYLVLGLTVYFYILTSINLRHRPNIIRVMWALMFNMLVLLIFTKTRNAWIACSIMFLIYGFLKDRKFLILLLLMLPLFLIAPQVQDRVQTMFGMNQSINYHGLNSFEWRWQLWKNCIPLVEARPLQGYGLTSFKFMSPQLTDTGTIAAAHNVYLETMFETGIMGLLSFVFLLLAPLILFYKNMCRAKSLLQSKSWTILVSYIISYMIICSADNLSYYLAFNWYVWFFIGLMTVLASLDRGFL